MTRRAYAVLAALVGTLLAAAPASADPFEWHSVSCATGAMTAATEGGGVRVTGWIQPCPESPARNELFAVMYYGAEFGTPMDLSFYATPSGPTPFGGDLRRTTFELTAVCLTFSEQGRLSCLGVTAGDGGEPVLAEISTDDPRVTVPVRRTVPRPGTSHPGCGTCV
jgi:hypothetical protein